MPSFNSVNLIGHCTRDFVSKQLPSGTTVAEGGLATNRRFKGSGGEDREEVCFIDIAAFGKQAEVLTQYARKGKLLFVSGRLKMDSWQKDGQKRTKHSIVIEDFQFLGGREDAPAGDAEPYTPPPARPQPPPKKSVGANGTPDDWSDFKESDIPF